jgi:hypothetical protein
LPRPDWLTLAVSPEKVAWSQPSVPPYRPEKQLMSSIVPGIFTVAVAASIGTRHWSPTRLSGTSS